MEATMETATEFRKASTDSSDSKLSRKVRFVYSRGVLPKLAWKQWKLSRKKLTLSWDKIILHRVSALAPSKLDSPHCTSVKR